MNSPCPFWKGKQVKDTHLLVLVPEQVNGKALTLDYLGELVQQPQNSGYKTKYYYYESGVRDALGSKGSGSSYWVLMTRDVIPVSRSKSYQDQRKLVADHATRTGLPYELPRVLEVAVVILLHYVKSGKRLYGRDNPQTLTRCSAQDPYDHLMTVGDFFKEGLSINGSVMGTPTDHGLALTRRVITSYDGAAALRKFGASSP